MSEHHAHADEGLAHDLPRLLERRRLLGVIGGLGAAAALAACGTDAPSATPSSDTPAPPAGEASADVAAGEIPEETAGPFPGDGSNGPNALTESGVVREDLTGSFGSASGVAAGVPLTLRLRVLDLAEGAASPLAGAAIYAWHCDAQGRYSMYDEEIAGENYLRGVQVADEDGWLQFRTVFPGCYAGRWPHVHFEVYPSVDDATGARNRLRTSQLALPGDACAEAYTQDGYQDSVDNLAGLSLDRDNVFSDGYSLQLAAVSGSAAAGYTATLAVPV